MVKRTSNSILRPLAIVVCLMLILSAAASGSTKRAITVTNKIMQVGQKKVAVNVLEVNLSDKRVRVEVGLADDLVGAMEDLSSLARRKGATIAINGTYFDAYSDGPVWNPVGSLITGGRMVHKGTSGTVIGFGPGNAVHMEAVRFKIIGSTNGSYNYPSGWYAYFLNRQSTAKDSAIIYTPDWGRPVGGDGGTTVVAASGKVVSITKAKADVPPDGFALHLRGSEESLLKRFQVGSPVEWKIAEASGAELKGFWAYVNVAIGAGPRLVWDGKAAFNISSAMAEGFSEAKILSQSLRRSAVGVNADGKLLLVTTDEVKMTELAAIMLSLGAKDAMSLDGGASSGLWYDGRYVTTPGRKIPNALLVFVD